MANGGNQTDPDSGFRLVQQPQSIDPDTGFRLVQPAPGVGIGSAVTDMGRFMAGLPMRAVEAVRGGPQEFDVPELGQATATRAFDFSRSPAERRRFNELNNALNFARDEQDIRGMVKDRFPTARFFPDQHGNTYVRIGDEAFVLNAPGLSSQDVDQFTAEAAGIAAGAVPAGRAGQALMGTVGRIGGVGLGSAAGSAGLDVLAESRGGRGGIDLGQMATAGGFAALTEALAPPIARLFGRMIRGGRFSRQGTLTPEGRQALQEAGFDPDTATPDIVTAFERAMVGGDDVAAVGRQQAAQSLPEPVRLTTGQATRDPVVLGTEAAAQRGAITQEVGQQARAVRQGQQQALRGNVPAIQQQISGRAQTIGEGSEAAMDALRGQSEAMRGQIATAFREARAAPRTAFPRQRVEQVSRSMAEATDSFDPTLTPGTARMRQQFDALLEGPEGARVNAVTLNAGERWRRRAVNARSAAVKNNASDAEGLRLLIKEYDDALDDALRNSLLSGDEAAIDAWKNARGLRARYGQIFEQDDVVKALTAKMRDGSRRMIVSPGEAKDYIFGRSRLGARKGMVRDLRKLRDTLGPDSQEWQAIRGEAFLHMYRDIAKGGDETLVPAARIANAFDESLRDSPEVMRTLFTPEEIGLMKRFNNTMRNVNVAPAVAADTNPSGTASMARILRQVTRRFGPIGDFVNEAASTIFRLPQIEAREAAEALSGELIRRVPSGAAGLPGTAGAVTARPQRQQQQR